MNNLTPTTSAVFIPEVWSSEIKRATRSKLVFANLVKRFDADVAQYGDKIHIPNISNLTANIKQPNQSTTPQAPTEAENIIDIDTHIETTFIVEDIVAAQSKYNLESEYTSQAGYAIANKIDEDIAGLYAGLSQTAGDSGTALQESDILKAIEYLDEADAPQEDRYFVIRPSAKSDILALNKFTNADFVSGMPVMNGMIGDLYGVKVFMTTNAPKVGTVAHNLLFQKEAFALAMQVNPRVQSQEDLEYLGTRVTVDSLYGYAEYRDDFGVDVVSLDAA